MAPMPENPVNMSSGFETLHNPKKWMSQGQLENVALINIIDAKNARKIRLKSITYVEFIPIIEDTILNLKA